MSNNRTPVAGERFRDESACQNLEFDDDLGDIDIEVAKTLTVKSRLRINLHFRNARQRASAITPTGDYVGSLTAFAAEIWECLKDGHSYQAEVTEVDLDKPTGEEVLRVHVWYA